MSTPRINWSAPLTRKLVGQGIFSSSPFTLVDVGASGGIEGYWRVFEPTLRAFGFDPLVKECERLNRSERSLAIRYFPYFVGAENYEELFPRSLASDDSLGWSNDVYQRTSAVRAQKLLAMSFTRRFNNDDPDIVTTDQRTSLDYFFSQTYVDTIDFVKVDTDGHDYEVLLGTRGLMMQKQILGFFVECQFHGISHPHANLFANIDQLLRAQGYSLFDIEVYRYTRAVLPGHFVYDIPAQTREGQVVWGDALYLRDATAKGYADRWMRLDSLKLLKLICIHELFGLPDCATELLLVGRDKFEQLIDVDSALDILAREIEPCSRGFKDLDRRFDTSPKAFFPRTATHQAARVLPHAIRLLLSRMKRKFVSFPSR